jgi:hypothetical protein
MTIKTETPPARDRPNLIAGILSRFGAIVFMLALEAAILFLAAGRLDWIWAWVFIGINLAVVLVNGTILMSTNPEMVAERGRPKEVKNWDKAVSGLWAIAQYLAIPLVAGLDARFGWTRGFGTVWNIAGAAVFTAGMALFGWAMITNAYFSTAARIQNDRGQTVCRSGSVPLRAPSGLFGNRPPIGGNVAPVGFVMVPDSHRRGDRMHGRPDGARGSHAAKRIARVSGFCPRRSAAARSGSLVS